MTLSQNNGCVKFFKRTIRITGQTKPSSKSPICMHFKACTPRFCSRDKSDSFSRSFNSNIRKQKSHRQSTQSSNYSPLLITRCRRYEMHRRKIGEITSGAVSSMYKVNSDYKQFKKQLMKMKLRSFEFKETLKNEQINKSN